MVGKVDLPLITGRGKADVKSHSNLWVLSPNLHMVLHPQEQTHPLSLLQLVCRVSLSHAWSPELLPLVNNSMRSASLRSSSASFFRQKFAKESCLI